MKARDAFQVAVMLPLLVAAYIAAAGLNVGMRLYSRVTGKKPRQFGVD